MKTASDRTRAPRSDKPRSLAVSRRSPEQISEGVRRQREHIMLMDGADPLRGGVAD